MSKKKSFIIHKDSLKVIDSLSDEEAGQLLKSIKAYQLNEDYTPPRIVDLLFTQFKNQFIRDDEKYAETCNNRAIAGSKGGKQKVANASKSKQKVANVAESDNDSDSDKDSEKDNKTKRFTPPSLIDIKSKILEKGYNVNAEQFFNHYESNGWMVGKSKMKKWHSALSNWNSRNNKSTPLQNSNQTPTWELGSK